ncbi:MAG: 23S rRNA (uracil(1939)-C(5))-methyltransferase RlmD [Solobacterium sp.]|nr:23S rRNA (uracil(1939)-C(5))-methyltransferase RlmD [Solobacterium sp.]MCH4223099.1 23S rRNA (uracil(1939)-C(5))-methyltransferase RlmD [Solobacterium sp.]MCH4265084.1 23S rRNA (uracil(1939)-C(5))-methyltransferase RlmD [Solobacterium sp.]
MTTLCNASGRCGGCAYINMDYSTQLEKKQHYVQGLFGGLHAEPVLGMADPLHYRHKVYATFGYDVRKKQLYAGLYEENTHKLVQTDDCMIQNETANRIIRSIVQIASSMHIEAFDERTGRGVLRHAYLRTSQSTGKVLLVLVIGSRELPGSKVLIHRIIEANPEIASIVLNWNNHHTSMVLGSREKVLYGSGSIIDELGGFKFQISTRSFYQVNPVQTQLLYETALQMAQLKPTDKVLDACCGIGTISLFASKSAESITGVEIVPEAIEDARQNAQTNNVKNVRFICADVEHYLAECDDYFRVIVLDPPRAGFSEDFLKALAKKRPEKIVYISCEPGTQARDTKVLRTKGYVVTKIQPVDMFPYTRAVENICLLQRQDKKEK